MKKYFFLILLVFVLCSHDMFLKLDSYFLEADSDAVIQLYNGTFDASENVIDRDRMIDASIVANGQRTAIQEKQWTEKDSTTFLNFKTGASGTYVAGVSTKARNIEMQPEAFNNYLEHDGVIDMLASRKENGELESDAIEKYSKHVKTIFQVGDRLTDDWNTNLGYPIEFIPLCNPYSKHTGDSLTFKLLKNNEPLANQLVIVDYKAAPGGHTHSENNNQHSHDNGETHSHDNETSEEHTHDDGTTHSHENEKSDNHSHDQEAAEHTHEDGTRHSHDAESKSEATADHTHDSGTQMRTNDNGELTIKLEEDGIWFLRTIHMVESEEDGLTHESNWATVTFEVTHDHADAHSHDEDHDHDEDGLPIWIFIAGSIVLIGGLFFYFSRKK
ncbi:DUF4198 domain-containing protein [Nonlabens ponticola]|uniref:DUF4198 domain-containing protein n=1 Tax=Nonlabens ponticola TaxID=2496866 RepID=A0A3S9N0L9_9FLAO|nr:DUF4198 domain-containing protein [Nonlabens ponticola]AZQ44970.1 DUF4198 domain-containing protein [Nonlabens ponticola]